MAPGASISRIRVMIVDDHPMLREGIVTIIERAADMEVCCQAEDGLEAVESYRIHLPDVTLMDIQMPRLGGVDAITRIRAEFGEARIVVLTTYAGDVQAQRALKAGAVGYLLKTTAGKELLETVRAAAAGQHVVHSIIAQEMAAHAGEQPLSPRELEVLRLLSVGQSNKEVARSLGISEDTVKGHLKNLFGKLNVKDRTEAVMVAVRRGILDGPQPFEA